MPYQFQSRIRYSEIGEDKRLTLPGLINYFQDCSTFQSETLGNGVDDMYAKGKVWVLAYWQIEIKRLPVLGEEVTAQTWAHTFKGFQGERNYRMLDAKGSSIACANSLWIYVDLQTGHPVRVDREVQERYPMEPALEMERMSRKIKVPEGGVTEEAFKVCRHHLDTNHHVNNAQYIDMAQEYLPKEWKLARVRVEYKNQAVLGDMICPVVCRMENSVTVDLRGEDGRSYAIVEFA
ncbi:acyl-[acyl-carrier-protein] thioesterase [Jingyaoa shaoxingensis]|uniref:Acyl-[acyl-carrier-protein] thioesterase n=1 Tax=Jingyaoa shaoxingensis TaxID=2763671 RepID=A0ABR7NCV5_9FIRM|nr:acyl-ACP thioesterase domain-containing protein [Jingyaoa shaoxingensis]MBC8574222.1 acyl-[acyl-carrier-protein] thioesterase [Jingyaoa shaoxingensis]